MCWPCRPERLSSAVLPPETLPPPILSLMLWQWVMAGVTLATGTAALLHVLLYKRDPRSAAYWAAIVFLVPLGGAVFYALFGVNFIRRKGRHYRGSLNLSNQHVTPVCPLPVDGDGAWHDRDCVLAETFARLSRLTLTTGNHLEPLRNGDEAMPVMLKAIESAESSVSLATYIFEAVGVGQEFIDALSAATRRGVQVRVMVDDAGTRYSWPPITRQLRNAGIPIRRFMPNRFIIRLLTMNLRNHRKILVVDGKIAFTGGINIREGNMLSRSPSHPVQDLHFRVTGPVVAQLQTLFTEDWFFCAGESLDGPLWFPELKPTGEVSAIGIPDGPDEDLEVMPQSFFAALSGARKSVHIVTPYFLPTPLLITALRLCALRGVDVSIVVPARNNIPIVSWAAHTLYPELLEAGCKIYESPPPFDHSKLFIVDGIWSFVGSTNWDPRSLRLNFEFNLACHDRSLARSLNIEFERKLVISDEITSAGLRETSLPIRLRNGAARLLIPLL